MKKLQVAFYGLWPEMNNYVKLKLKGDTLLLNAEKLNPVALDIKTNVLAVFVDSAVTKEVIEKLPHLKLIVSMSTGFDHIDMKAARAKGVVVCNVPTYGENTVAEHTFALILGLTRKLFPSVKRVKEGVYDWHGLRGVDIKGKTLGVVGTGHIGTHVIRMAKGFGMEVVAFDARPNKELADDLGFTYVSLDSLLKQSHIVTLHTPLLPNTRHLINKQRIKKMKSGSFLINTARGALVDPAALVWGLESGHLAGAGLDVLEDENLMQSHEHVMECTECEIKTSLMNNMIIDHPNTIVTPHNAFNSVEALKRIVDVALDNIKNFADGKPQNIVSLSK